MFALRPASELRALRAALATAGFNEAELRTRITTPPDHAVNATRYYPEGFPGHDTPLDDLVRLLMIGARVSEKKIAHALGGQALSTLLDSHVLTRENGQLSAKVTVSLWQDLIFLSDREDAITCSDFVMPPEAPAVWMTNLIAKHAPPRPQRVLDIGTGCGVLALLAAPSAARIYGVDSNPRAVAFAQFNAALNGFSHCEFTHAPAQALTSKMGTFDRITFNCPGLYEVGCIQPEAFSCADGDDLLRAVYALLPTVLAAGGTAILRHDLPAAAGYLARLLGDNQQHLHIQREILPHYAGLTELRTACAIVRLT